MKIDIISSQKHHSSWLNMLCILICIEFVWRCSYLKFSNNSLNLKTPFGDREISLQTQAATSFELIEIFDGLVAK